MKTNRDFPAPLSALGALVDASAAINAAQRLYQSNRDGFRHCCDSREILTTDEAMARDAREAARRARPSQEAEVVEDFTEVDAPIISFDAMDDDDDDDLTDDTSDDDVVIDFDDDDIVAGEGEEIYEDLIDEVVL